ncbi:YheC/YheD family protein [Paenibacillus taihuensis]|uniref:YheC/YheD family protein n=1 Tax=Paenibacillus taihuensis TaxID=1156355 RepID=UPI001FE3A18A|nr:YheC/YheD family protein [Paenibacillus taihuensis]
MSSKWKKTAALLKDSNLSDYVPETVRMSNVSLRTLLKKYEMVYIKPVAGSFGIGVMRVKRTEEGYQFQVKERVRSFKDFDNMYRSILKNTNKKNYLVQKGIHLLKHNGRRFDLRVMAQYAPNRRWETTGIIGRVAAKNKIVTNFHSGGTIVTANRLLSGHTDAVEEKLTSLSKLGVTAGKAMQRAFPGVYVIGLDVALDKSLRPWILEVNTSPDPYIFRKHPKKSMFRKIMRYAKSYPKSRA